MLVKVCYSFFMVYYSIPKGSLTCSSDQDPRSPCPMGGSGVQTSRPDELEQITSQSSEMAFVSGGMI